MNVELIRNHLGQFDLAVAGRYAIGAQVTSISQYEGELAAIVVIPLKHCTVAEQSNVVPLRHAEDV